MPTLKQRKAVEKTVEFGGNLTKGMRAANYAEATVNNPKNLTESKGFKELCDELGLTETLLTEALVEDIKAKKGNRKAELELGYKVRGLLKEQDNSTKTLIVVISGESGTRYAPEQSSS
jgi:hypothetical protein